MYKNIYKYDDMKRREHMAVREHVGWYLWTHQLVEVQGEDARDFLDLLCTKMISTLKTGKERYTTILDENAEIIDDVVVFRLEEQKFWVSTLFAGNLIHWMASHQGNRKITYKDVTDQYHMYAVQGPDSMEMINKLTKNPIDELKFFSFEKNQIEELPVIINRAGFTGEKKGYEIYVAADQADRIEELLHKTGDAMGAVEVTEFQVMAWTLPTEAGFYYMRDLRHTNPLEVGMEKGIGWDKEFIGKEALLKIKEEVPLREMVGFTVDEADVYIQGRHLGDPGQAVLVDGEEVGRVYKFVYSYVKDKNIGYILARKNTLKPGDKIKINGYDAEITEKYFL